MKTDFDRNKSLQELERDDWGEPTHDSFLVKACHDLRRKPLIEFTVEDLRLMIGQAIGLAYLVPIALDRLEEEPLAEGDLYPGDLLTTVLKIAETFWAGNPESFDRARRIISKIRSSLSGLGELDRQTVLEALQCSLAENLRREPQIGEEEVQRRLREGGGRSLAEIMSDLEKRSREF
jgi:CDI immunity proteins